MTAAARPKRFNAAPMATAEEEGGEFVHWTEYEALAQAFVLYMEEGMDSPEHVEKVLTPHLGEEDAKFVAELLDQYTEKVPPKQERKNK